MRNLSAIAKFLLLHFCTEISEQSSIQNIKYALYEERVAKVWSKITQMHVICEKYNNHSKQNEAVSKYVQSRQTKIISHCRPSALKLLNSSDVIMFFYKISLSNEHFAVSPQLLSIPSLSTYFKLLITNAKHTLN